MTPIQGLGDLVALVAQRRPLHARFIRDAYAFLLDAERVEADRYLRFLLADHTLEQLAEAYETIVDDTFESQMYFVEHGRYQHSRFDEVASTVYFNDAYMKRYMLGLALTCFLWTNHVKLRRFFAETFPWDRQGRYLEVGPGHGLLLLEVMEGSALTQFTGVDISAASLALTDAAVRANLPAAHSRLRLLEADFFADGDLGGGYDVLVMGEVIEHVERPQAFLERLRALAAPDAHVFVTTCINTPAIDHITLFETEAQVEALLKASGFSIRQQMAVPYQGKTIAQCVKARLPISVGYVLA